MVQIGTTIFACTASRTSRAVCLAAFVSAVLLLAAPVTADAARVTDVRVGHHRDFTRIVFELDGKARHRIERNEPAAGIAEIVITIDAASTSKTVKGPDISLVEQVKLRPEAGKARARVLLRKDGLSLKTLVLREPHRIVIDVLSGAPKVAAAPKPAPKPVAKPAPKPVAKPVPKVVAKPAPAPAKPAAAEPMVAAPPRIEPGAVPPALAPPQVVPKPDPVAPIAPIAPIARPRTAATQAPAAKIPTDGGESSGGYETTAYVLGGLALLGGAGWFVARRRSASGEYEEYEDVPDSGDNPFSGLGLGEAQGEGEAESPGAAQASGYKAFDVPAPTAEGGALAASETAVATPIVGDTASDGEPRAQTELWNAKSSSPGAPATADVRSEDHASATTVFQVPDVGGADAKPSPQTMEAGPVGSSAGSPPIDALESRIAKLETELEDSRDGRERLERQLAAQNEELRVQRAAIARTQRAVRNLTQQSDAAEATEPALRTPSGES